MTARFGLAPRAYGPAGPASWAVPTPRGRAGAAWNATRVNPLVRAALYAFVMSIPFEWPSRPVPIEVPSLVGVVFLTTTLLHPSVCFRRIPGALLWFIAFLWVSAVAAAVNGVVLRQPVVELFINYAQVLLLFWVTYNVLGDPRVVRGVLLALVAACAVRAGMQVTGMATTAEVVWTGGTRVTVLGQNPNLSAIILSAGLTVTVGFQVAHARWLPRLGVFTWPLAALLGVAIIQTGSRGGLLCAGAGLTALLLGGRTPAARLRAIFVAALAVGLLVWEASQSAMLRGRLTWAEEGNLAGREQIYPAALAMFEERPVLGWGPIANQYEIARRIEEPTRPMMRDAHNLVLELLTTTGAIGALPFLAGLGLCIRTAWRARLGPLGIIPLALLAAVLMGTVTGTWIVSKILWFALAFAAGTRWATPPVPAPNLRDHRPCAA